MTAYFILFTVFLFLSAVFSAMEIAYESCNKMLLERKASKQNAGKSEKLAFKIADGFSNYLSVILLGNDLVNTAIAGIASVITANYFSDGLSWAGTAISTVLVIIFGEIVPKFHARINNISWTVKTSIPLKIMSVIFLPLTAPFTLISNFIKKRTADADISAETIECAVEEIEKGGIIDNQEAELLQNSIDFEDTPVFEIAVPRVDIKGIDIEDSVEVIKSTVTETNFSRLVVYKGSHDVIIGIILTTDILSFFIENRNAGETQLKDFIKKEMFSPLYFNMTKSLASSFRVMKKEKKHLAVITDEFGGTYGIVTMEDIIEELSGEIWDESDAVNRKIEKTGKSSWKVSGDVPVREFFEEADCTLKGFEEIESTTLGGLATELLDRLPRYGDRFSFSGLEFTIERVSKRRVLSLKARLIPGNTMS